MSDTYVLRMIDTKFDDEGATLELESDSLARAAFVAGAHWMANYVTSFQAMIFGTEATIDKALGELDEPGELIITGELKQTEDTNITL